jgi:hypothetical protein
MGKARSKKSVGFFEDAVNFVEQVGRDVARNVPLLNSVKNRDKTVGEAVNKADAPAKPKPKPTTPQTKNKQLAKDEKASKKLSKAQVEEIRKRLKKGDEVKVADYE